MGGTAIVLFQLVKERLGKMFLHRKARVCISFSLTF